MIEQNESKLSIYSAMMNVVIPLAFQVLLEEAGYKKMRGSFGGLLLLLQGTYVV